MADCDHWFTASVCDHCGQTEVEVLRARIAELEDAEAKCRALLAGVQQRAVDQVEDLLRDRVAAQHDLGALSVRVAQACLRIAELEEAIAIAKAYLTNVVGQENEFALGVLERALPTSN